MIQVMNLAEIKKLISGNPDEMIRVAEKLGIDFSGLDPSIAKKMVKEQFSLTDADFEAVDFVFWISYFVERSCEELIVYPELKIGARKEMMEAVISKLHFGDKIKIIEELYVNKKDDLVKLMRKIQDLRNHVAHGRFDSLRYGGYHLSDNRGKLKLIGHLRDAFRKK
jgi:hypothetical protein